MATAGEGQLSANLLVCGPDYGAYGQLLFELCQVTRSTAPSLESRLQRNGMYAVKVTVGNEGPSFGCCCNFYCEAEKVAVKAWLGKYQPNWKQVLQILHTSTKLSKRLPASLYSHCESGNIDAGG